MEGCYIPKYLPASFKGIPFIATEVTSEHGRRGATGEFPFGEFTAYADLGRRIRTYSISGKFPSNDHIFEAGLLIAACEAPGPGVLVHPTRGLLTVACTSCKVRDNVEEEMGFTYVDLEFVEANLFGSGFQLGASITGLVLTGLALTVRESFLKRYVPSSTPFYQTNVVLDSAVESVRQIASRFSQAVSKSGSTENWGILADMNAVIANPQSFTSAEYTVGILERSLAALARVTTGSAKLAAFKSLSNWAAKSSDMRGFAGQSIDALYSTVRTMSAAYMAKGFSESSNYTIAESLKILDDLETVFTEEAQLAFDRCDNAVHLEIMKYWSDTRSMILNRVYNLPPLVEYQFNAPVSSLTAAYEIYGDSKRFREVESMNPGNWGFIVGPNVIAARA